MKHIFTTSIFVFLSLISFSQAGTLDKSFSVDGRVVIGFKYGTRLGEDDCFDMALQADGKSVLVGASNGTKSGVFDFAIVRLNTNGTLDQTFNNKGYTFINFLGNDEAVAVAIQSDGKIVVAGVADFDGIPKVALVRLLTNGTPDPTFGSNFSGKVITDFGDTAYAVDVAIQTDGKIVVAGAYYGSVIECMLLRYNTDGSLDQSFGVLGRSFTNFGWGETANSLAIQSDGKIVIGGNAHNDYVSHFIVARFKATGFLDGNFGNAGKRIARFGYTDHCASIAIMGNGKIVAVGNTNVDADQDIAIARFDTYGTIDNTFSGDGKVLTDFSTTGSMDYAKDVAVQSDGKIIVAGATALTYNLNFALLRYNSNGTLDNTFSGDGKTQTDFGASQYGDDDEAYAVKIQSNGKIIAAGARNTNISGNFIAARYNGDNATPNVFASDANIENSTTNESLSTIHLYPNPVSTALHVEGLNPSFSATISITDLSGRVFQTAVVTSGECSFDVSRLKPGVYELTAVANNVVTRRKFIKQ
ncbi:MAG TPA: T9SS type A sorting domain-containing protein [Parafilimonas sp.]|nr:T9SS type A sorting domain-containing protein [Parafilimonas sp.]